MTETVVTSSTHEVTHEHNDTTGIPQLFFIL